MSKVLAHFTAQADLIPINPIIVDVAGGGRCCQSFWFQLSPQEWHFGMNTFEFTDGVALFMGRYQRYLPNHGKELCGG